MREFSPNEATTNFEKLLVQLIEDLMETTGNFISKNCDDLSQNDLLNMLKDGTLAFAMKTFSGIVMHHVGDEEHLCHIIGTAKQSFDSYIKNIIDEKLGRTSING